MSLENQFCNFINFSSLITQVAKLYPNDIAFTYITNDMRKVEHTYSQVKYDVEQIGCFLRDKYGINKRIALISSNSYEYIIAFIAIIFSGNVAVPINRNIDEDELVSILEDCKPSAIFFSGDNVYHEYNLERFNSECLNLEHLLLKYINQTDSDAFEEIDVSTVPCCIIYTSGTSGVPKGVMLSQTNILTNAASIARTVKLEESVLLSLPLHHMYAWSASVLMPMMCGIKVIINQDSKDFGRDLKSMSPTNIIVVPAILEFYYKRIRFLIKRSQNGVELLELLKGDSLLSETIETRRNKFSEFTKDLGSNLRIAVCGAAMLDRDLLLFFEKIGVQVLGAYGMTECSPVVSICSLEFNRYGSVGKVLDCNDVMIQSENDEPYGEILVKGPNVMLGYYNKAVDTAQVMQGEWLRSGDIGYFDCDGYLYIKGRIKNLIIRSSGENIAPEEIELRLLSIKHIDEVIVCEDKGMLLAKVYSANLTNDREHQIKKDVLEMNSSLPAYKRIDKVVFVESPFERTSTNKIKRGN